MSSTPYADLQAKYAALERERGVLRARIAELEAELAREVDHREERAQLQAAVLAAQRASGLPAAPARAGRAVALDDAAVASRLAAILKGEASGVVLIDGHNALFGMPSRYQPPRGTRRTEAEKRELLVADVQNLFAPLPGATVRIVFDGAQPQETRVSPMVSVLYSGGQGRHRADKALIDQIRFLAGSLKMEVLLVSDDLDLRTAGARLGALPVSVATFGSFMPSTSCDPLR